METRLSTKRKESEKEAAEIQAQILTRSAAKRARAAGITSPLLKEPEQGASPAAGTRSQRQPRVDKCEPNKGTQHRTRASGRRKSSDRRQRGSSRGRNESKQERASEEDIAGASIADRRQEEATAQEGSQADEEMDRQRRSDGDEGPGRDSADDEVCVSLMYADIMTCCPQLSTKKFPCTPYCPCIFVLAHQSKDDARSALIMI